MNETPSTYWHCFLYVCRRPQHYKSVYSEMLLVGVTPTRTLDIRSVPSNGQAKDWMNPVAPNEIEHMRT